jgi:penicillin-binding protein A
MKVKRLLGALVLTCTIGYGAFFVYSNAQAEYQRQREELAERQHQEKVEKVRKGISAVFESDSGWPETIIVDDEEFAIEYSFDQELTTFVERLLRRHRSDFSAIVVIENDTGRVLTALGFERSGNKISKHLAFSSTHPAASLIKIVTAASLFENGETLPETTYNFHGRGTTLFRNQVMNPRARGSRAQTFERAFAYSNNVIFGRAAIEDLGADHLFQTAKDFGFNRELMTDIRLSQSVIFPAKDDYNLAELSSGFNRETMMSPIHASLLPQVIANGGVKRAPRIIERVRRVSNGEVVWENDSVVEQRVVSEDTAQMLERLMGATTRFGTARGLDRRLPRTLQGKLNIGGKTGSLTGGVPFGRRDWFVAYATPQERQILGNGISIAVMNVNIDRWYVKSTYLAQRIIAHYFTNVQRLEEISVIGDRND